MGERGVRSLRASVIAAEARFRSDTERSRLGPDGISIRRRDVTTLPGGGPQMISRDQQMVFRAIRGIGDGIADVGRRIGG